jgi:hypothetical protein
MRQAGRLRPLEVRVSGEDDIDFLSGPFHQDGPKVEQGTSHLYDFVPHPEQEIGRDLVVAAPARVELSRYLADNLEEAPLHVHVDILEGGVQGERARFELGLHLAQTLFEALALPLREDPLSSQHPSVGKARPNVLTPEPSVDMDGARESFDPWVRLLLEAAAPGLLLGGLTHWVLGGRGRARMPRHTGACKLRASRRLLEQGWQPGEKCGLSSAA